METPKTPAPTTGWATMGKRGDIWQVFATKEEAMETLSNQFATLRKDYSPGDIFDSRIEAERLEYERVHDKYEKENEGTWSQWIPELHMKEDGMSYYWDEGFYKVVQV